MKTFNKNSWHFWLANHQLGGLREYHFDLDDEIDFCSYSKRVLRGLFWAGVLFVFASIILRIVFDVIGHAILSFQIGKFILDYSFFATFGHATIVLFLLGFICWGGEKLLGRMKFKRKTKTKKEPSFISTAYDSFKNKYCFYIKFK